MLALKEKYSINEHDLVICLISGGGSALMPCPVEGISLGDKQKITELLLKCGAEIREINSVRKHLSKISGLTKESLISEGFCVKGEAHILAVEIGDESMALEISKKLLEKDIFVLAARYPTVPLHKAILRIGMTALHTEEDVENLVSTLKEVYEKIEKAYR